MLWKEARLLIRGTRAPQQTDPLRVFFFFFPPELLKSLKGRKHLAGSKMEKKYKQLSKSGTRESSKASKNFNLCSHKHK